VRNEEIFLIVDANEGPHIDRDHQLTAHGSEPHRHKAWWIVAGIALLLLLVLALVLWRHHEDSTKKAAPAPPKITITTATAKKGDIGVYLDAIGTVTPVYTDSITSQVAGLIIAVHYKEGQVVKKGDPLVDIDSRAYRANLLQAQGALKRDQNVLAQAQMDLERYRVAWSHNGIAKQILDDQEKLVLQDEGTVQNDQGIVQFDQVQVDYCHIIAPIAGRAVGGSGRPAIRAGLSSRTLGNASRLVSTACRRTLHRCGSRWKLGRKAN
jgi:membrane fusion protein, multidrug efflux system